DGAPAEGRVEPFHPGGIAGPGEDGGGLLGSLLCPGITVPADLVRFPLVFLPPFSFAGKLQDIVSPWAATQPAVGVVRDLQGLVVPGIDPGYETWQGSIGVLLPFSIRPSLKWWLKENRVVICRLFLTSGAMYRIRWAPFNPGRVTPRRTGLHTGFFGLLCIPVFIEVIRSTYIYILIIIIIF